MMQSRQVTVSWRKAPSDDFCGHLHPSPRNMPLHPPLACEPLKRKPVARGRRAPRAPTIVGWFCQMPWLGYTGDSVAPPICPLARAAARALLAVIGVDAQNDSRLATTPSELTGVGTAVPSPRCDEPAQLSHGGWSDSLSRYKPCSAALRGPTSVRRL